MKGSVKDYRWKTTTTTTTTVFKFYFHLYEINIQFQHTDPLPLPLQVSGFRCSSRYFQHILRMSRFRFPKTTGGAPGAMSRRARGPADSGSSHDTARVTSTGTCLCRVFPAEWFIVPV